MSHYEYCEIIYVYNLVVFYSPGGLKSLKLKFDKKDPASWRDFEQWKQETGWKNYGENRYARDRFICQLLADGWEWWQSRTSFSEAADLFRRQPDKEEEP